MAKPTYQEFLQNLKTAKPYPKWAKDNTSTVPNDPANEINRAKGEPQKEAPSVSFNKAEGTETVHEGRTDVVVDHLNKPTPALGNMPPAKQHYPPCINPTCKSVGKSHPNCLCYAGPGGTSLEDKTGWMPGYGPGYAEGGRVCSGPHHESCEYYADGGMIEENNLHLNAPNHTLDHIAVDKGLLHLLTKTGHNGRAQNQHQHFEDYLEHARKGRKSLNTHVSKLIGKEKLDLKPDQESIEALKSHLDELEKNPDKAFEIGGKLGSVLPNHAAALGAKAGSAINYFQGLKPKASQVGPLDPVLPPNKLKMNQYDRQLGIAQNPMLVLHHAKHGTLRKQDLITLNTLYPTLGSSIPSKAGEAMIEAKQNGTKIPYTQKQGLSTLMGQPLDSLQTPMMMQAIIRANAGAQSQQSQPQQPKPKKASGTELKQIDKTNSLSATSSQDRQIDQRK